MSTNNTTTTGKRDFFGTHTQRAPEVRSILALQSWDLNPRDDETTCMAALAESLQQDGQIEDVHVMLTVGAEVILRGHRRVRAMRSMGWTECRQVVHKFSDLRDAYRFAIIDHGHTVPLNNNEKLNLVTNGQQLGLNGAEIASTIGVAEETVTKYTELALGLPLTARVALAKGLISMNVAELILTVEKEDRTSATQLLLHDPATNEPMSPAVAKASIEARYILPKKWEREWVALSAKLKKKDRKVADGFQYVEFADRLDYLQGNSGQPWAEYEYGDGYMPGDREGRRWMEHAAQLGVPVFVVAAPTHVDGHVLLVSRKMLRDAMAPACGGKDETRMRNEEGGVRNEESAQPEEAGRSARGPVEKQPEEDRLGRWLKTWLGAIYEALVANPTDTMTKEPWLPLRGFLAHLVTDVDAGAFEAWTGISAREQAEAWIENDTKNRAHLRTALMLLLCAEADASEKPEMIICEVGKALGLDAEALDEAARRVV